MDIGQFLSHHNIGKIFKNCNVKTLYIKCDIAREIYEYRIYNSEYCFIEKNNIVII